MTELQKQVVFTIASIVPDYGVKLAAPPGLDDHLLTQHGYDEDQLVDIVEMLEGVLQIQLPENLFEGLWDLQNGEPLTARHLSTYIEQLNVL